jgi:hypothetical protein
VLGTSHKTLTSGESIVATHVCCWAGPCENGGQGWNLIGRKDADFVGFFALTGNTVAPKVALLL